MHNITIIGNVTKEIELKSNKNGIKYTVFSIASNYYYGKENKVTYFKVVAYGQKAEYIYKYLKPKGRIYIEGIITQNKYTTSKGITKEENIVNIKQLRIADYRDKELDYEFENVNEINEYEYYDEYIT